MRTNEDLEIANVQTHRRVNNYFVIPDTEEKREVKYFLPTKKLYIAMLEQALADLVHPALSAGVNYSRQSKKFKSLLNYYTQSAISWIFEAKFQTFKGSRNTLKLQTITPLISFKECCDGLGLERSYVRKQILAKAKELKTLKDLKTLNS